MPALEPTDFAGRIVWLGCVGDRDAALASVPLTDMALGFEGFAGESRAGLTRASDSRVLAQHPRGTEIRNVRQISLVSAEELAEIAAEIGLERLDPALLGASAMVAGIPDFTLIPPSSRLQGPDGVTLVVDMENLPCHLPAREIEARHPGHGAAFRTAARQRRGVTGWVERPGVLRLGEILRLHIPAQPAWPHRDRALSG
jgi:MOSC domain-containing protein YiiM